MKMQQADGITVSPALPSPKLPSALPPAPPPRGRQKQHRKRRNSVAGDVTVKTAGQQTPKKKQTTHTRGQSKTENGIGAGREENEN
ncbi:hypothetical protein P8452_00600 [Trifolium repens]|nr:hypothetical protein P8452_00600 [Trifolium repens]